MGRFISPIWKEFTEVGKYVICNHCRNVYSKGSGSNLKRHLIACSNQKAKKKYKSAVRNTTIIEEKYNLESFVFDLKFCYKKLATMIVTEGYPFSIVNDIGFKVFIKNLQPQFEFINEDGIKDECIQIYKEEKLKLQGLFQKISCRVSFALDLWNTDKNVKYVSLTCYYIDGDWNLNTKILNFLSIDDLQSDISKVLAEKLIDWNLDNKIFGMVLGSYNEIEHSEFNRFKNFSPLGGEFFRLQTTASVLNMIARDITKQVHCIVDKVRKNVQYVSSQEKYILFNVAATKVGAPQKPIHSDMQDNWGTTYSMLESACEFQAAFVCLAEYDNDYTIALSSDEWDMVRAVTECLSIVYHTLEKFSSTKYPTSNLYFNDICYIHLLFKKWRENAFPVISTMASHIFDNFEQYWSTTKTLMAIAAVLDPRYKMKSIEYYFDEIYNDKDEADDMNKYIRDHVVNLFDEYANQSKSASNDQPFFENIIFDDTEIGDSEESGKSYQILIDVKHEFDLFIEEAFLAQSQKSELDLYLDEDVYQADHLEEDFDILHWWKHHAKKYPVLSRMARDILSIPVFSFTKECESEVLNQFLSSLDPVTVQALICGQDWLKNESEGKSSGQFSDASNIQKSGNLDSDGDSSIITLVI